MKRMELWGLGGKENLAYQQWFREEERKRKQKASGGKEEFLASEFDKEFLLGEWKAN